MNKYSNTFKVENLSYEIVATLAVNICREINLEKSNYIKVKDVIYKMTMDSIFSTGILEGDEEIPALSTEWILVEFLKACYVPLEIMYNSDEPKPKTQFMRDLSEGVNYLIDTVSSLSKNINLDNGILIKHLYSTTKKMVLHFEEAEWGISEHLNPLVCTEINNY